MNKNSHSKSNRSKVAIAFLKIIINETQLQWQTIFISVLKEEI